jgi:hypothetical protein
MKDYNGFTPKERSAGWRVQKAMREAGTILDWTKMPCDMCGQVSPATMPHQENYFDPRAFYPLCVECHMRLHARFNNPDLWVLYLVALKNRYKPYIWRTVFEYIKRRPTFPVDPEIVTNPREVGCKWFHELTLSYEESRGLRDEYKPLLTLF